MLCLQVQQEVRKKWNRKWKLRRFSTASSRSTRTTSVGSTVCIKDKSLPALILAGNKNKDTSDHVTQDRDVELRNLNGNHDATECEIIDSEGCGDELL